MSLSFNNRIYANKVLLAKAEVNDAWAEGPFELDMNNSLWLLLHIQQDSASDKDVIEGLSVSMAIEQASEKTAKVTFRVSAKNTKPACREYSMEFVSDNKFYMGYFDGSTYMYSSKYGLDGSKGIKLDDGILKDEGVLIGYSKPDGKYPGGESRMITVSVKLQIINYDSSESALEDANQIVEWIKRGDKVPTSASVATLRRLNDEIQSQSIESDNASYEELKEHILKDNPGCLCVENIKHLFDVCDSIGIVKVENEAGLRQGYFARLRRKWENGEGTPDPDMGFVRICAREFGVTIDELINVPLSGLSKEEIYNKRLLNKFYQDTTKGILAWKKDKAEKTETSYVATLPNVEPAPKLIITEYAKGKNPVKYTVFMSNEGIIEPSLLVDASQNNQVLFYACRKLYSEITKEENAKATISKSDKSILDKYLNS